MITPHLVRLLHLQGIIRSSPVGLRASEQTHRRGRIRVTREHGHRIWLSLRLVPRLRLRLLRNEVWGVDVLEHGLVETLGEMNPICTQHASLIHSEKILGQ